MRLILKINVNFQFWVIKSNPNPPDLFLNITFAATFNFYQMAYSSKTKTILAIVGFALFITGFLSIFLSLVGINLSMFSWINKTFGNGIAFFSHIVRIIVGLVLIYLAYQREE